jgi:ethanolamine ammonia-lyase small subunit
MMDNLPAAGGSPDCEALPSDPAALMELIRARTPARLLVGRAGPAYPTAIQLELRQDHAAAVDAVQSQLDVQVDFAREFVQRWNLFEVSTRAGDKTEYLMRPDLGRRLSNEARQELTSRCPMEADLQVAVGDGLSAAAVTIQAPSLLPLLAQESAKRGWKFGQPFLIRYCRVGVLNAIGEILNPAVVVLLIGERPGLATAESLSAYMAYRPRPGHTDAQRNLISNIHSRGVSPEAAASRIAALAEQMIQASTSGVVIKEDLAVLEKIKQQVGLKE